MIGAADMKLVSGVGAPTARAGKVDAAAGGADEVVVEDGGAGRDVSRKSETTCAAVLVVPEAVCF
jgi:hypothetical protein